MTLSITPTKEGLKLVSPFHPALPEQLKRLGGRWDAPLKVWYIPQVYQDKLREIRLGIFGIDPLAPPSQMVTVKVYLGDTPLLSEDLWILGRQVLRRAKTKGSIVTGAGVALFGGIVTIAPTFIGQPAKDTYILVNDVPEDALSTLNWAHEIVETEQPNYKEKAIFLVKQLEPLFLQLNEEEQSEVLSLLFTNVSI